MANQLSPSETQTSNLDNIEENELPKARFWEAMDIVQWEGFWFEASLVKPASKFRSTLRPKTTTFF
ncbi:hypothetical protein ACS0TY_034018 [Phlomoides rotata]